MRWQCGRGDGRVKGRNEDYSLYGEMGGMIAIGNHLRRRLEVIVCM